MFSIINNQITLTRGDTAIFKVYNNGEELNDGDTAFLTVKKTKEDDTAVLQVEAQDGTIYLYPEDTQDMEGHYLYDIQIDTAEGLVVSSPIGSFVVLRGITE